MGGSSFIVAGIESYLMVSGISYSISDSTLFIISYDSLFYLLLLLSGIFRLCGWENRFLG